MVKTLYFLFTKDTKVVLTIASQYLVFISTNARYIVLYISLNPYINLQGNSDFSFQFYFMFLNFNTDFTVKEQVNWIVQTSLSAPTLP